MGAKVDKTLKTKNTNIIDYATNGSRTDLLDIYIAANCHFFIGGNNGLDNVPLVFRRSLVKVNYMPIEFLTGYTPNHIVIFKKHWLKDEKRFA